jgi:hypothetical protein
LNKKQVQKVSAPASSLIENALLHLGRNQRVGHIDALIPVKLDGTGMKRGTCKPFHSFLEGNELQ